jgi:predicted transcriptional regulator
MYKKVENNPGYLRDMETRAIISVDSEGLSAYKRQREFSNRQESLVSSLSEDVSNIKQEMQDIKEMLAKILTSKT